MEIIFKNKSVEKQFSSKYQKTWRYPELVKRKLQSVEVFIQNADSLQDIVNYPPYHFHSLKGN